MSNTIKKETQVDIEINDICYDVTFNRVSKFIRENYGSDADGNRGEMRTYVDEDYPEDIHVDGNPLTDFTKDLQNKIEEELEAWLRDNEVEE
jgi:hypothetical protein